MRLAAAFVIALGGLAIFFGGAPAWGHDGGTREAVDFVRVDKSEREMTLWRDGRLVRALKVRLGRNPVGPKQRRGDGRTPEGLYFIDGRNPNSKFHLSLHISYPNQEDRARAAALGVPPGSAIVIHGLPDVPAAPNIHKIADWTEGCIAVENAEIEYLWDVIEVGTPIEILP